MVNRELTDLEIKQLLQNKYYGHISCCIDPTRPYLVPVTYVYKDNALYCYSYVGEKIDIMRKQPKVCFQVEDFINDTSWQSAMIWGTYKELEGQERADGATLLIEKFWNAYNQKISIYFPFRDPEQNLNEKDIVIFAISIEEETGRHDTYDS